MHTMWKGSISFGLVSVPVRMYKATESQGVRFRQLHKTCQSPIQYVKRCPTCEVDLKPEDIVKGFEYARGQFVVIEDEELEATTKTRSQTLDIIHFTDALEIDPVYFDSTYYLAPEASGRKAYALLADAMGKSGRVAVAKTVLRQSESMALVRMKDNLLVVQTLFWPNEVRKTEELPFVHQPPEVSSEELEMALKLISELSRPFDADLYHDERLEQVQTIVSEKLEHVDPTEVRQGNRPQTGDVVSLMEALQKSINMAQPAVKPARKSRKKSS